MQAAPITRTGRRPARRTRTALAAGLLTAVLALSGCGAASDSDSASSSDERALSAGRNKADAAGEAAADAKEGAAESGTPKKPDPVTATHVIRTASLSVQVKSASRAAAAARAVVQNAGGLVADESTEQVDDTHDSSHLVLRVPQAEYDRVLRELSGAGKLISRSSAAKDVTDQVVDVESRIATQRASVARVRKLMDRADKLADVVTLEGELSSRQASLESLLAQQASLKDRTALATITLDLMEPETAPEADEDPGFLDALSGGWHAFLTMLRWLAVAVGAAAPFLAAAAVLLVLWRLLARRAGGKAGQRPPTGE
ncbi:DUF4349 domain-containing protein [Streptomyces sp. NBC_00385]|uniref:DUF4349 domain-containing protein n=1 Tax=Streptomyces sp. NBC_00385 TaxID=2975733 RepID=UPI002DDA0104|nr:DUF4349 domain-containing protein [Streptomyces sp. NBC_00385]WRZ02970.1 DUF4349 domain-containing protein [Streptomyces sp. NBC_00385]